MSSTDLMKCVCPRMKLTASGFSILTGISWILGFSYDFFDVLANVEPMTVWTAVLPHFGHLTLCLSYSLKVSVSAKVFLQFSHWNS